MNALLLAAWFGHLSVLKILVSIGAKLTSENKVRLLVKILDKFQISYMKTVVASHSMCSAHSRSAVLLMNNALKPFKAFRLTNTNGIVLCTGLDTDFNTNFSASQ